MVTSSAFRQIAYEPGARRQDQAFKASIAAFSMIERPSRREISTIEDLGLGLYNTLSHNAKRYAAEALAENNSAPRQLVRRLAQEPASICAPLLLHSPLLSDADLVELIAQHGLDHGRLIARRRNLNRSIADLIRYLRMQKSGQTEAAHNSNAISDQPVFEHLARSLHDNGPVALANALSQRLAIPADKALQIALMQDDNDLAIALRYLGLDAAEAFLIAALRKPANYPDRTAMDGFLKFYASITPASSVNTIASWRAITPVEMPAHSAAMVM